MLQTEHVSNSFVVRDCGRGDVLRNSNGRGARGRVHGDGLRNLSGRGADARVCGRRDRDHARIESGRGPLCCTVKTVLFG